MNIFRLKLILLVFISISFSSTFSFIERKCFSSSVIGLGVGATAAIGGAVIYNNFLQDIQEIANSNLTDEETKKKIIDMINNYYYFLDTDNFINDIEGISKEEIKSLASNALKLLGWVDGGLPPGNKAIGDLFYAMPFLTNPRDNILN